MAAAARTAAVFQSSPNLWQTGENMLLPRENGQKTSFATENRNLWGGRIMAERKIIREWSWVHYEDKYTYRKTAD